MVSPLSPGVARPPPQRKNSDIVGLLGLSDKSADIGDDRGNDALSIIGWQFRERIRQSLDQSIAPVAHELFRFRANGCVVDRLRDLIIEL